MDSDQQVKIFYLFCYLVLTAISVCFLFFSMRGLTIINSRSGALDKTIKSATKGGRVIQIIFYFFLAVFSILCWTVSAVSVIQTKSDWMQAGMIVLSFSLIFAALFAGAAEGDEHYRLLAKRYKDLDEEPEASDDVHEPSESSA